jgi:transposase InsO family protein
MRLPLVGPPPHCPGGQIHTDMWGPTAIAMRQGCKYFTTFTDDVTRYTVTYLLRTKDEALEAYKSFEAWAITQGHCTAIKVLPSDHGSEYLSRAFDQHLKKVGMVRKLTTHNTPQLNGVAERLNRPLLERICALIHTSGLPKSLWGEALRHAAWLKNRTAMCTLNGKMPFEALYGRPPDLSTLRFWGSQVWVHSPSGLKLDVCAQEAHWLGPDVDAKAHCIFWLSTRNIAVE